MAASGNPLKSPPEEGQDSTAEVIPPFLVDTIHPGVPRHIYGYAFDAGDVDNEKQSIWLKQPATRYTFFGISSLQKQILALAEYAGPLDQIEAYIRLAHTKQEPHLQATLMQAITLTVTGLDHAIRDKNGHELDEGMAERLLALHAELFPEDQEKALEQARLAAPPEDKETKTAREEANVAAMEQLFTAFVQNDEYALPAAIDVFKEFVKNSSPLNLLHLIVATLDVFVKQGGMLPPVDAKDERRWHGKLANRFCFEIIGGTLEAKMPHRVRQILRIGLDFVFEGEEKAERELDVSGAIFKSDGTHTLGLNLYYNAKGSQVMSTGNGISYNVFKAYYEQLHRSFQNLLHSQPTACCSIGERVSNDVEIRRSSA